MGVVAMKDEKRETEVIPWEIDGRIVPMTVVLPTEEERVQILNALADFLWEFRHLGREKSTQS